MEPTNRWPYEDVVGVQPLSAPHPPSASVGPASGPPGGGGSPPGGGQQSHEFQLSFRKGGGRKTDSFRFSSEHRAEVISDALRHHHRFAENNWSAKVSELWTV